MSSELSNTTIAHLFATAHGQREEISRALLASLFTTAREHREEFGRVLPAAQNGLAKLVKCCAKKTAQSHKVRALIFSLSKGKPVSLRELSSLDHDVCKALLAVLHIVGLQHDLREAILSLLSVFGTRGFFYKTVFDAIKAAGLSDWFLEGGKTVQCCSDETSQGHKVRALLYSLWKDKPAPLVETVSFDHELHEVLLAALGVFWSEDFFKDAVLDAFHSANLTNWFLEEGETTKA